MKLFVTIKWNLREISLEDFDEGCPRENFLEIVELTKYWKCFVFQKQMKRKFACLNKFDIIFIMSMTRKTVLLLPHLHILIYLISCPLQLISSCLSIYSFSFLLVKSILISWCYQTINLNYFPPFILKQKRKRKKKRQKNFERISSSLYCWIVIF